MSEEKIETWYEVIGNRLQKVRVHRHTAASVWVEEQNWSTEKASVNRRQREGSFHRFFPSEAEGMAFIEKRLTGRVERLKKELNAARTQLGMFRAAVKDGTVTKDFREPLPPLESIQL